MTAKQLPQEVTYLDIIKTVAVVIMIIDHIGFYFFPEQLWWRAIGRAGGAPVWFFLIGYAITRDLPNRLLIGALILAVADFVLFDRIFAMSALVTIILLRLIIDPVMKFLLQSRYIFALGCVLIALFYVVTRMAVEYGTLALLFAMLGYLTRHKEDLFQDSFLTVKDYYAFMAFTIVMFSLFQNMTFGFNEAQFAFMACVSALVTVVLVRITPRTFPSIKNQLSLSVLHYCGRQTLDIYVAHLLLFKIAIFTFSHLN